MTIWFALIALQSIDAAARPENFETVSLLRTGQSEMNAQIILSLIAGSRLDVTHQNLSTDGEFQLRSYAVAVALGSDGADQKSVVAIATVIAQQVGSLPIVADQNIQITIVVEIPHDKCAADFLQCESRA